VTLRDLNSGATEHVTTFLADTLFSSALAAIIVRERPFAGVDQLCERAARAWTELSPEEQRASFDAHPRIGDVPEVRRRPHSRTEQRGIYSASPEIIGALAVLNRQYEERFGFRFLVFASGKSADEMLAALTTRLQNSPEDEFRIAAHEKRRINEFRLRQAVVEGAYR